MVYSKEYYQKNKERILEYHKKYRKNYNEKNKEKIATYKKRYCENNKEKRRKSHLKYNWKRRGLDMDTFYYVIAIYDNTIHCDKCNVFLEGNGKNQKCMDHCHATGIFRNILCKTCNNNIIGKKSILA